MSTYIKNSDQWMLRTMKRDVIKRSNDINDDKVIDVNNVIESA